MGELDDELGRYGDKSAGNMVRMIADLKDENALPSHLVIKHVK
jgi:hypothetical protein